MKIFRDMKLNARVFELYQSFGVWCTKTSDDSNVTAMVDWANDRFRIPGGFNLDEFNAMLRNNWMDAVRPATPVTAEMFEVLDVWTKHSTYPEYDLATQSFQDRPSPPPPGLDIPTPPQGFSIPAPVLGFREMADGKALIEALVSPQCAPSDVLDGAPIADQDLLKMIVEFQNQPQPLIEERV